MHYTPAFPAFIPSSTQADYSINPHSDPAGFGPSVGDVNIVTYQASNDAILGCTFRFVYQGNGKFTITSATTGCKVQNGTDLVLP